MDMTKASVKEALGLTSDADLARIFDIGRWAVGQWPSDGPIPKGRQLELLALYPDVFRLDGKCVVPHAVAPAKSEEVAAAAS